jgi:hypothetical protein
MPRLTFGPTISVPAASTGVQLEIARRWSQVHILQLTSRKQTVEPCHMEEGRNSDYELCGV